MKPVSQVDIDEEIRTIVYRHIAWLYALKHAMWQRTTWAHQQRVNTWYRNYFEKNFAYGSFEDELTPFLSKEEYKWLKEKKNAPAQLLGRQS